MTQRLPWPRSLWPCSPWPYSLWALATLFAAIPIFAQPSIIGNEFQVNTYTTSWQIDTEVAAAADGDFIVVWHSDGSPGTDIGEAILAQRYDSAGMKRGDEFQVNTYTTAAQRHPAVAAQINGDFVVVWESFAGTGDPNQSIQGQVYNSNGLPLGGQFQVNTYTTNAQLFPSVSMAALGNFVVTWTSQGGTGNDFSLTSVQAQLFNSLGGMIGSQFQVNTYTDSYQSQPSAAMNADGEFVIAWMSFGSSGNDSADYSVQAQRYASDGSPKGGEFQVNTYTTASQFFPDVAIALDGDFVVAWNSEGSNGDDNEARSIQAQLFSSDGSTMGGEFQVNSYTTSNQEYPTVAMDADGNFTVAWESIGSNGSDGDLSIQSQNYHSDGSPNGNQLQVNTTTGSAQVSSATAMDFDGDVVVVWESFTSAGTDSNNKSIQAQLYGCVDDLIDTLADPFIEDDDTCEDARFLFVNLAYYHGHCDEDWATFDLQAGQHYRFETTRLGGGADTVITLYDGCGAEITTDDDGGLGLASRIDFTPTTTGTYTLQMRQFGDDYVNGEEFVLVFGEGIFLDGFESGDTSAWSAAIN